MVSAGRKRSTPSAPHHHKAGSSAKRRRTTEARSRQARHHGKVGIANAAYAEGELSQSPRNAQPADSVDRVEGELNPDWHASTLLGSLMQQRQPRPPRQPEDGSESSSSLYVPYPRLSDLLPRHVITTMRITPNAKLRHKITSLLYALSDDQESTSEAGSGGADIDGAGEVGGASRHKPRLVVLQAKGNGPAASKLVSVVEIAKRELSGQLSDKVLRGAREGKESVASDGRQSAVASTTGETGEEDDKAHERLPKQENQKLGDERKLVEVKDPPRTRIKTWFQYTKLDSQLEEWTGVESGRSRWAARLLEVAQSSVQAKENAYGSTDIVTDRTNGRIEKQRRSGELRTTKREENEESDHIEDREEGEVDEEGMDMDVSEAAGAVNEDDEYGKEEAISSQNADSDSTGVPKGVPADRAPGLQKGMQEHERRDQLSESCGGGGGGGDDYGTDIRSGTTDADNDKYRNKDRGRELDKDPGSECDPDSDDAFEMMQQPLSQARRLEQQKQQQSRHQGPSVNIKIRAVPVLSIFISTVRVPELERFLG